MSKAPPPDFTCQDCGLDVYQCWQPAAVPDPPRCSVCAWLVEFVPDPAERDSLRERVLPPVPS